MIGHREALESAWRAYRTKRGAYVPPQLFDTFEAGWRAGVKVGQQEAREQMQQTLEEEKE